MCTGATGGVAADKYDPLKYRENMNLQFGMVAAQPDDIFLMASDGLRDTLDPVQVGHQPVMPHHTTASTGPDQYEVSTGAFHTLTSWACRVHSPVEPTLHVCL